MEWNLVQLGVLVDIKKTLIVMEMISQLSPSKIRACGTTKPCENQKLNSAMS